MGDNNPNAQVEANLLEGKNRYTSAATTLQDIKRDLDSIAAGLQSSWLVGASQDYQDKQGKLTTTVQSASDVLQKGSTSIGKMYDSYIEADEKQKRAQEGMQIFMEVFMIVTALFGLICPILEAADVVFAAEIDALDVVVEVSDVTTEVAGDTSIADTTLVDPGKGSIDEINVPNDGTSPGNDPSTVSEGTTTPVDPIPPEDPAAPPPNGETPSSDAPVEPPQTDDGLPNGDGTPEETTQGPSVTPPEEGPVEPYNIGDATSYGGDPTAENLPDDPANENFQSVHTGDRSIFQNDDGSITQITVDENGDITIADFENGDDFFNSIYDDYAGLNEPNSPSLSTSPGGTPSGEGGASGPLITTKTIGEDGSTSVTMTDSSGNVLTIETDSAGNETVTYKGVDGSVVQTKIDPSTNTTVETIISEGTGSPRTFTDTDGTTFEIIPIRPRPKNNE